MNVSFERIAMSDLMDSFRLDGKVALVTGATYGIGMAIAEALGEAGAKIAFNARHARQGRRGREALPRAGL